MRDFENNVKQVMADSGITPPEEIIFDDVMHRFSSSGKRGDDSGYYRMMVEPGEPPFGFGFFGCWRSGLQVNWHSKGSEGIDPERLKKAMKSAEMKRKEETEKANKAAKIQAVERWDKATPVTESEYLTNKGIAPSEVKVSHVRQSGEALVIAMRNAKAEVCNLQYIWPDGKKRFIKGSSTKGLYSSVGNRPAEGGRIWVAEGYATAHDVHLMTDETTIIAFSADSLLPIAKIIAKKYPKSMICFAGDSGVVGENKAQSAALTMKSLVAIPPAHEQYGDWNDARLALGVDAARLLFEDSTKEPDLLKKERAEPPESPPEEEELAEPIKIDSSTDWREQLLMTEGSKTKPPEPIRCEFNLTLYFEHHSDFAGSFGFNDMNKTPVLISHPDWFPHHARRDLPQPIDDNIMTRIYSQTQKLGMGLTAKSKMEQCLLQVAADHGFNPLTDLLDSLEWDGVDRTETWLIANSQADDTPLNREISKRWLISAVARAYQPGCKVDCALILEGEQGVGKSKAVAAMAMGFGTDATLDPHNKDSAQILMDCWIAELAELTTLKRAKDVESFKAFMSKPVDHLRLPYARTSTKIPRHSVFIGTTNEEAYLADSTGSRRLWPIHTGRINLAMLAPNIPLIWAEAVRLYQSGEQWWLSDDLEVTRHTESRSRNVETQLDDWIKEYVERHQYQMVSERELVKRAWEPKEPIPGWKNSRAAVAASLQRMGWHWQRDTKPSFTDSAFGERRPKVYWHPDLPADLNTRDIHPLRKSPEYKGQAMPQSNVTPFNRNPDRF